MDYDQFNNLLKSHDLTVSSFADETLLDPTLVTEWEISGVPNWVTSWFEYRRKAFLHEKTLSQLKAVVDGINTDPQSISDFKGVAAKTSKFEYAPVSKVKPEASRRSSLRSIRRRVEILESWVEKYLELKELDFQKDKRIGTRMFDFVVFDANGDLDYIIEVKTLSSHAQVRRVMELCDYAVENSLRLRFVFELDGEVYLIDEEELSDLPDSIATSLRNPSKLSGRLRKLGNLDAPPNQRSAAG